MSASPDPSDSPAPDHDLIAAARQDARRLREAAPTQIAQSASSWSSLETQVELTIVGGRAVYSSDWAREKLAATAPSDLLCR